MEIYFFGSIKREWDSTIFQQIAMIGRATSMLMWQIFLSHPMRPNTQTLNIKLCHFGASLDQAQSICTLVHHLSSHTLYSHQSATKSTFWDCSANIGA